jgi:hypothetical protein
VNQTQNLSPQEIAQSAGTTPYEADVTSSNPPSPLLCGYVKKNKNTKFKLKKRKTFLFYFILIIESNKN